jgi:uncharacterized protein
MTQLRLPIVTTDRSKHVEHEGLQREAAHWHRFNCDDRSYLFVTDGSQIYEIDGNSFDRLTRDMGGVASGTVPLTALGVPLPQQVSDEPLVSFPITSLSLAIAQKCNLGCTYCYAQEGSFGAPATAMSREVALAAVDRLFEGAMAGQRFNLAFLGGEPLLGRNVLRETTEYAAGIARDRGLQVGFSITSNGTVLTPEDGEFFERHGFAVTISLDGVAETHNQLRPFKNGSSSFDRILANIRPVLALQNRMQVSARVTVTPRNLDLVKSLNCFVDLGFHSIGFSPMLASPTGREQMGARDLDYMLEQMMTCGREFERRVIAGQRYPFSNMVAAMKEIHHGTHRPYPCGAGAGYLGVSADGELSACHRFVGDAEGMMGNLRSGVNREQQAKWLADRHVHRQEPCRSCWAQYLCGGGCHHEVIKRGRPACDYIRGWLHYCLQAYVRLLEKRPDYFGSVAVLGDAIPS